MNILLLCFYIFLLMFQHMIFNTLNTFNTFNTCRVKYNVIWITCLFYWSLNAFNKIIIINEIIIFNVILLLFLVFNRRNLCGKSGLVLMIPFGLCILIGLLLYFLVF